MVSCVDDSKGARKAKGEGREDGRRGQGEIYCR